MSSKTKTVWALCIISLVAISCVPMSVSATRTAFHQETPTTFLLGLTVMLKYTITDETGDGNINGNIIPRIIRASGYTDLSSKPFAFTNPGSAETIHLFWNYTPSWIGSHTVYYNNTYSSTYNQTGSFTVYPLVYASSTIYPSTTDVQMPVYLNYTAVGNGLSGNVLIVTPFVQRPDGTVYSMLTKTINVPTTNGSSITTTWTTYQTVGGSYDVFFDDASALNLDSTPSPSYFFINFPQVPVPNQNPIAIIGSSTINPIVNDSVSFFGYGFDGDGYIVNYTWTIDGNYYYDQNVTYSFDEAKNYLIILTIEDNDGGNDFDTITIYASEEEPEPNEQPLAILGVSSTNVTAGDEVYFYGYGFDSDGVISTYTWYIDGNEYHTQNVTYSFSSIKNYLIIFTVEDDDGSIDIDTDTIHVFSAGYGNIPPSAIIDVSNTNALVDEEISFNGFGFDEDGYISNYTWNVDGHVYYEQNITYSFSDTRTYIVILTVTDNNGGKGITTVSIIVTLTPVVEEEVALITYIYVPVLFVVLAIIFAWNYLDTKTKDYVFTNNFLQSHADTIAVVMLIIALIDFFTHIITNSILWLIKFL